MEELFPTVGPWLGLPCRLQALVLYMSLDRGLPTALEQFTQLEQILIVSRETISKPMHLDRPLCPFLDMANLKRLEFSGNRIGENGIGNWTLQALKMLGMARKRIQEGQLLPRSFILIY